MENLIGGSGSDQLTGNIFDNVITGGAGIDTLRGSGGQDTALFTGNRADYDISEIIENNSAYLQVSDLRENAPDGTNLGEPTTDGEDKELNAKKDKDKYDPSNDFGDWDDAPDDDWSFIF